MGLPFSLPGYIRSPKTAWRKAVEIECYGLCTECLGGILIDNNYWLEGMEASGSFYLLPANPKQKTSFADASFIADCLSFEHEIPVAAFPARSRLKKTDLPWQHTSFGIAGISPKLKPTELVDQYYRAMRDMFCASSSLTNGNSIGVVFRYDQTETMTEDYDGYDIVRVPYATRLGALSQSLHLYNAALRQPEPLFQYLGFYRVIESRTQNNGKTWIEGVVRNRNLDCKHPIWGDFYSGLKSLSPNLRRHLRKSRISNRMGRVDLLEIMRAQAIARIETLISQSQPSDVARRLYTENRCGIAHGGQIRRHDFADDFVEVLRDLPLIRYLARLSIEEAL